MTAPFDPEDFLQWREHHVTRASLQYLNEEAQERRDRWTAVSFDGGKVDPLQAAQLRGEYNGLLTARDVEYEAMFPKKD